MKKNYTIPALFLLLIFSFSSCVKDKFNVEEMGSNKWDPDFAAPVINSSVTMKDVVKEVDDEQVAIGSDQLISLFFTREIFTEEARDMISIPDQIRDTTFLWNYPIGLPPGDSSSQSYLYSEGIKTANNEIIDTLYLKSGKLSYHIETDMNHDGVMELKIPGLTKNGKPFRTTLVLDYTGSLPQTISNTFDVSGYKAVFTHAGNNNYLQTKVTITGIGDNNPVNSPYKFDVQSSFENLQFARLYGYLSQYNFDLDEDSLNINLYDNTHLDEFVAEDPKVHLRFSNSFGMPVEATVNKLQTYNPQSSPSVVDVTKPSGAPLDNIMVDAPNLSQIGDVIITNKLLDKNNSTIDDGLNIEPEKLIYDIDGLSNPSGNAYNFALDTSKLRLEAITEFPLYGTAKGFDLEDTVDFDISEDIPDKTNIKSVDFQIFVRNQLPIDANVQIYFTDTNYVMLDSLFTGMENIIPAADPGPAPDYRVTNHEEKRTYISRSADQINNILEADKAIIRVTAATVNNGNQIMKIYADYKVDVKLGVRTQIETEF